MTSVDDFLSHHGILGMKWGVRKQENRVSNSQLAIESHKLEKEQALKSAIDTLNGLEAARKRHGLSNKNTRAKTQEDITRVKAGLDWGPSGSYNEGKRRAREMLVTKYGEKRISKFEKSQNTKNKALAIGILSSVAFIPIVAVLSKPILK